MLVYEQDTVPKRGHILRSTLFQFQEVHAYRVHVMKWCLPETNRDMA